MQLIIIDQRAEPQLKAKVVFRRPVMSTAAESARISKGWFGFAEMRAVSLARPIGPEDVLRCAVYKEGLT